MSLFTAPRCSGLGHSQALPGLPKVSSSCIPPLYSGVIARKHTCLFGKFLWAKLFMIAHYPPNSLRSTASGLRAHSTLTCLCSSLPLLILQPPKKPLPHTPADHGLLRFSSPLRSLSPLGHRHAVLSPLCWNTPLPPSQPSSYSSFSS